MAIRYQIICISFVYLTQFNSNHQDSFLPSMLQNSCFVDGLKLLHYLKVLQIQPFQRMCHRYSKQQLWQLSCIQFTELHRGREKAEEREKRKRRSRELQASSAQSLLSLWSKTIYGKSFLGILTRMWL